MTLKVRKHAKGNPNAPRDLVRDPFTSAELKALAEAAKKAFKKKARVDDPRTIKTN